MPSSSEPSFRDVAAESGLRFRFDAGSRGRHDLPEIMGGGVGLIDVDGDGRLDVYLCDGGPIVAGPGRADPPCRLFLNRGGRFEDITDRADAPGPSCAMGVAVGDYDGDGRDDLLVTGWRDRRLYRNLGGGRFEDATARAGVGGPEWSTSAAWADLDGDGDLDLYVAAYLDYDPASAPFCAAPDGRRDYCGPEDFAAQPDRLYRNRGDGTFEDVSKAAGVALPGGRGLGVLVADLAGDPRPDIYVANDGSACWLFENKGGMRFEEVGLAAGVALDGAGSPLAGMGVALGDLDGDGRSDLVATNFLGRGTVAFRATGRGAYEDASAALGLAAATRDVTGFGVALADLDGDGRPDLIQANGHVLDRARLGVPSAMRPTVLKNSGGRLADAASGFGGPMLGRGLAVGDLDGDGRPDVVIGALDVRIQLLKNVGSGNYAVLELGGRPSVGARVRATVGGKTSNHEVVGGGSYLSASDRRIYVGLGDARRVDSVEVRWPSGRVESWSGVAAGATRLVEGRGVAGPK